MGPIFEAIQRVTGCPTPYGGLVGDDDVEGLDMAYRVVADHIRTLTVAITDGAQPGSQGRNYVLRTVLRRAVRFGIEKLGADVGFLNQLVQVVVDSLKDAFPEMETKVDL